MPALLSFCRKKGKTDNKRRDSSTARISEFGSTIGIKSVGGEQHFCSNNNMLDTACQTLGDNTCTCMETSPTPFSGSQESAPTKDLCNFFLSQCCIRVEMMFAQLISKWRILKKPLECSLNNNNRIVCACSRLSIADADALCFFGVWA